ncbi:MAG: hypothetical protein DWQ04_12730 [Chloroflexi bacterium]|nr:MAG: hypothetical protein DWQ04_12730 [Chloroflexota bacterium]
MTTDNVAYLTELHQLLSEYFNLAEIQALCFELGIDYESVPGDEKPSRIRALILSMARNGRLPNLVAAAHQMRRHVDWPPVPNDFQLPKSLAGDGMAVPANQHHIYGDDITVGNITNAKAIAVGRGASVTYQEGLSVEEVAELVVELKNKEQLHELQQSESLLNAKANALLPHEPETVPVSAGSFWMGADEHALEAPRHEVDLRAYFIGKYLVTNRQYAEFIRQAKRPSPNTPDWFLGQPVKERQDYPAVGVSWYDAQAYCQWLSETTGKTYRLPTEAEWEKAARGTDGRLYPWGNEWQEGMCNQGGDEITAVTAYDKHRSPYGCVDMIGNVQQWTSTIWGSNRHQSDYPYPYRPDAREQVDAGDDRHRLRRIYRGSTFSDAFQQCRCSIRKHDRPKSAKLTRGFRVVWQP